MKIAGHIIGFIAIGLFFLSYQVSDKKKLIVIQTAATATMCLQYLLIGAYSGFALNIVCIIRNILFCHRDKRLLSGKWMPFAMAVVMAAVSALSWEGYHSIIIVAGLMINTVCMAFCDAQGLRKSILVTCPMVIVYNVIERSYSGIISESVSLCSAIIGIIRHVRETKAKQNNTGN